MTTSIGGTTGITFNDASSQNTAATGFGFKNRIINGAMVFDQRNAGASVTLTSGRPYIVDRFWGLEDSSGTMTAQQSSVVPAGFSNSLLFTTTASATVSATQGVFAGQSIEGFNVADLGWGSANAAAVTLSFWVRSSLTGTFGGALTNSAETRSYPFSYTISAANTWEQKTITVAGDTSGTWLTTNGVGIKVIWGLGVGSTYSGTAGAWAGSGYYSATGATSVIATNGATFYITGVQLEKGSTATSFDYRPYGTELALCQRYYWKGLILGLNAANSQMGRNPMVMRSSPSMVVVSISSGTGAAYTSLDSGTFYQSLANSAIATVTIETSGAEL
jgi:hypothetical protein